MESEERAAAELAPAQEGPAAGPEQITAPPREAEDAGSGAAPGPKAEPGAQPVPPLLDYALEEQLARGRRLLNEEMRIIGTLDPAVKSLADLKAQPEFGRFDRLVKSGLAISDAYKLACFDRLGRQQAAAARQAAINALRGKEHLAPVGGGPDAEDGLTDEIIQNYRQYNPRWTRAQIAAFHRSYKQGV